MWTTVHLICTLYICVFIWIDVCAINYVIHLQRAEHIKGHHEDLVNFSQLKVIRKGSKSSINGSFTFHAEMDNSFSREIKSEYSPLANSRFIKQPFQIEKTPLCVFVNTTYRKFVEPILEGHSNFPQIPPEGMCPTPKGTYFLKDGEIDESNLPTYLNKGLWKVEDCYYKGTNLIGGLRILVLIEDKN